MKRYSTWFAAMAVFFSIGGATAYAQQSDSLDIKIGQMIMVGMSGKSADKAIIGDITSGKIGGVIIYEKNITEKNSYVNLKRVVWDLKAAAALPLLVSIDQEGGKVNRLKEKYGFPKSMSAAALGKTNSLDSARFYNEITAATLAGLGINVNFAPVVDLSNNPDNPIIAKVERAYGASPEKVTRFARVAIEAHRKFHVATVVKHFPGHGSSKKDTHLGMADVTDYWTSDELEPYEELIKSGHIDAVMTAHIVNKRLESEGLPCTLSKAVITGLLRDKMGHQGVVFSDDMQMHAIASHYGLDNAIKLSILAGVDVLMFSNNIQGSAARTADAVHGIIKGYVMDGTISKARIDESYRRIMALKAKV